MGPGPLSPAIRGWRLRVSVGKTPKGPLDGVPSDAATPR